jgi:hypothetical protein
MARLFLLFSTAVVESSIAVIFASGSAALTMKLPLFNSLQ